MVYDNSFYWFDVARLQGVDERNVYSFVCFCCCRLFMTTSSIY